MGTGIGGVASLEGFEPPQGPLMLPEFEQRWTGGYIFENERQSFRTRQNRDPELTTAQLVATRKRTVGSLATERLAKRARLR